VLKKTLENNKPWYDRHLVRFTNNAKISVSLIKYITSKFRGCNCWITLVQKLFLISHTSINRKQNIKWHSYITVTLSRIIFVQINDCFVHNIKFCLFCIETRNPLQNRCLPTTSGTTAMLSCYILLPEIFIKLQLQLNYNDQKVEQPTFLYIKFLEDFL